MRGCNILISPLCSLFDHLRSWTLAGLNLLLAPCSFPSLPSRVMCVLPPSCSVRGCNILISPLCSLCGSLFTHLFCQSRLTAYASERVGAGRSHVCTFCDGLSRLHYGAVYAVLVSLPSLCIVFGTALCMALCAMAICTAWHITYLFPGGRWRCCCLCVFFMHLCSLSFPRARHDMQHTCTSFLTTFACYGAVFLPMHVGLQCLVSHLRYFSNVVWFVTYLLSPSLRLTLTVWYVCFVAVVRPPVACGSLLLVTYGCPSYHASFLRVNGLECRKHRMRT